MSSRPARLDGKILGSESQLLLGEQINRADQEEAEILPYALSSALGCHEGMQKQGIAWILLSPSPPAGVQPEAGLGPRDGS